MSTTHKVVLVVDDETPMLQLLSRAFDGSGLKVITAADIRSAQATLTNLRVDAMIVDIRLGPGTSGLELLPFARERDTLSRLPIIILTGMTHLTPAEEDAIRHHQAYVFYKPITVDEILTKLEQLLKPVT